MSTHKIGSGRNTYTLSLGTVSELCARCQGRGTFTEGDPPVIRACGCYEGVSTREVWRLFDGQWVQRMVWPGDCPDVVNAAVKLVNGLESGRKSRLAVIPPLPIPPPPKKTTKRRTMSAKARAKRREKAAIRQAIAVADARKAESDDPSH